MNSTAQAKREQRNDEMEEAEYLAYLVEAAEQEPPAPRWTPSLERAARYGMG